MTQRHVLLFVVIFLVALLLPVTSVTASVPYPEDYDDFQIATIVDGRIEQLCEDAITNPCTNQSDPVYLFFPPGTHELENPINIDRDAAVFLHGGNRWMTRLVPKNPSYPLFQVDQATLVNITDLKIEGGDGNSTIFSFPSPDPIEVHIQDCFIEQTALQVTAPGTFRVQGTAFLPESVIRTPVELNHTNAELIIVGGNISQTVQCNPAGSDVQAGDNAHIVQRHGRLQVYGTGLQRSLGVADILIERSANLGPHVITNVRTEGLPDDCNVLDGTNPVRDTLVKVDSNHAVDVLIKNNGASWQRAPSVGSRFVDYSGTGTVWLIGNNSLKTEYLAVGNAPDATIVALGNNLQNGDNIFGEDISSQFDRTISSGNVFEAGAPEPLTQFVIGDDALSNQLPVPSIPQVAPPHALLRPTLNALIPGSGMIDVTTREIVPCCLPGQTCQPVAAECSASLADTNSIKIEVLLNEQADSDQHRMLYFPAGRYEFSSPIRHLHESQCIGCNAVDCYGATAGDACLDEARGGWIAGAGPSETSIVATGDHSTFVTQGMAFSSIQGFTFITDSDTEPNVALEWKWGVGSATRQNAIYDCHFFFGKYALGIGLESQDQCSENLVVDSSLNGSDYGLGVGGFNAVANILYDSTIESPIAMGHGDETCRESGVLCRGGTWSALYTNIGWSADRDLAIFESSSNVYYFYGVSSPSARIFNHGGTAAGIPIMFEASTLAGEPYPSINFGTSGGVTFLHSSLSTGTLELTGTIASKYGLKLHSTIPTWDSTSLSADSRIYEFGCLIDNDCSGGICATAELTCCSTADCVDDGLFCNGVEHCDPVEGCSSTEPCSSNEYCDEAADECVPLCPPIRGCGPCFQSPFNCSQSSTGLQECSNPAGNRFSCPTGPIFVKNCPCMGSVCPTQSQQLVCQGKQ